jgi:hypothetical protein
VRLLKTDKISLGRLTTVPLIVSRQGRKCGACGVILANTYALSVMLINFMLTVLKLAIRIVFGIIRMPFSSIKQKLEAWSIPGQVGTLRLSLMVILAIDFALFITMRRQFMEPLYAGNIVMFGADIIFLASSSMLSKYDQHAEVKSLFSSIRYHLWRDGVLNTGDIYSNVGLSRSVSFILQYVSSKVFGKCSKHTKLGRKLISMASFKSLRSATSKIKMPEEQKKRVAADF